MAVTSDKENTSDNRPPRSPVGYLLVIGPGIVLAATGIGAGDMVAATVAGAKFGLAVAWACVLGAVLKFVLSEGVARWQLATHTSVIEGWADHLPRVVRYYFLAYLVVWTIWVGVALMSACGIAAHAMVPVFSHTTWAVLHSVAALLLVLTGRYAWFENSMKLFIGIMFISIIVGAISVWPGASTLLRSVLVPAIPKGSLAYLLGVIGGVGGTVTLLSYGYWIHEHGWKDEKWVKAVRVDLGTAYLLTGFFGAALIILASQVLHAKGIVPAKGEAALQMAAMLGETGGAIGKWVFLIGFWGAVASSMLGVWQGVPYLFADLIGVMKGAKGKDRERMRDKRSRCYRGYLLFIAFAPIPLLALGKPVALNIAYAVIGSLFMPFLAGTLLYMNNRRKLIGKLRNGILTNALLALTLLLFAYLGALHLWQGVGFGRLFGS
ncbi:MAG: divalent metal cation transporter [Planctomycetes bacterium]|nr:divalent metal cation transporter [Planctomycetota bacterium]